MSCEDPCWCWHLPPALSNFVARRATKVRLYTLDLTSLKTSGMYNIAYKPKLEDSTTLPIAHLSFFDDNNDLDQHFSKASWFSIERICQDYNLLYKAKLHRQDSRKKDSLTYSFPPFKLSVAKPAFPWSFKVYEIWNCQNSARTTVIHSQSTILHVNINVGIHTKNLYTRHQYEVQNSHFPPDLRYGLLEAASVLTCSLESSLLHTHILQWILIRRKWTVLC